jgi:hypothetical protein
MIKVKRILLELDCVIHNLLEAEKSQIITKIGFN